MASSSLSLRNLWHLLLGTGVGLLLFAGARQAALETGQRELRAAVASQGLVLESGEFELDWLRGLVVRDLVLALPQRGGRQRLGAVSEMEIDFDLGSVLRGEGKIRQLRVRGASLSLPAEDLPLRLEDTDADLLLSGDRLHLLQFQARYHGLLVRAHGSLAWGDGAFLEKLTNRAQAVVDAAAAAEKPADAADSSPAADLRRTLERQAPVLADLERVMARIRFQLESSQLELAISPGSRPGQVTVQGTLEARDVQLGAAGPADGAASVLSRVLARGEWDGERLHLPEIQLAQGRSALRAELRGEPQRGHWRGRLNSSLNLGQVLTALDLGPSWAEVIQGQPHLELSGTWQEGHEDWRSGLDCFGSIAGKNLVVGAQAVDQVRSGVAWRAGAFQLRGLRAEVRGVKWQGQVRWAKSGFQAELQANGPARELLEASGSADFADWAEVLDALDAPPPVQLDLTLTGRSLEAAQWQVAGRWRWLDGPERKPNSSSLATLILEQLPDYQISGTLAQPRWQPLRGNGGRD